VRQHLGVRNRYPYEGTDCAGKGELSISFIRAFVKELVVYALKIEKKIQVLNGLIEGNSIRSTERMTGVHRDTIYTLYVCSCKLGMPAPSCQTSE